jgi:hypothetical protein
MLNGVMLDTDIASLETGPAGRRISRRPAGLVV